MIYAFKQHYVSVAMFLSFTAAEDHTGGGLGHHGEVPPPNACKLRALALKYRLHHFCCVALG